MEDGRYFIRGWGYSSDEETRDPGFQVGSYAIPKDLSLKFDHAVLSLKAAGFDIDRSDILETLISGFVHQLDIMEQSADPERGLDVESILAAAGEGSGEAAGQAGRDPGAEGGDRHGDQEQGHR